MAAIPRLEHLFFYTTWECNLYCKHCWVGKNTNSILTQLTVEKAGEAIEQAIALGLRHIKLSGGEPLLTRELTMFIIKKAKENEIGVSIETNGTLIDAAWANFFCQNGAEVSISIDSSVEEEHDAFRGMQGAFRKSLYALDLLYNEGVSTGVVMSISSLDYDKIERMIEMCYAHHVTFLKLNPIVHVGRAKKKSGFIFALSPEEMLDLYNHYGGIRNQKVPVVLMLPLGLTSVRSIVQSSRHDLWCGNCPTLNLLSIMPNGDFGLCADAKLHETFNFGNIFEQDLDNVWSSHPSLLFLREVIPSQLEGVCGQCMVKDICKGSCRAVSVSAGGKINSPHPICHWLYEQSKFPIAIRNNRKESM